MLPATSNTDPRYAPRGARRPRNRCGCFLGCLTLLIVLILLVGASWLFAVRPYVHNIAQTQLDNAMSNAIQQIPPQIALAPPSTITVQETALNNLIKLNLAPSDPVQNPQTQITPSGIRLSFQLYGLPCAISTVPAVANGQLTATNTSVEGVAGLIMSPSEMQALLNKHFAEAQARIKHSIQSVQLREHEMVLQLG